MTRTGLTLATGAALVLLVVIVGAANVLDEALGVLATDERLDGVVERGRGGERVVNDA